MRIVHRLVHLDTGPGIDFHDLTPRIRQCIDETGITDGFVIVTSRHTTTALFVNENEPRLLEDVRRFLARLLPAGDRYLHNDIHLRDCPPDEPENAHSHIAALLLASSETIPVADGAPALGTFQSVLLAELDGPRRRTVNLQVIGT